jgi:hypothetical protein
LGLFTQLPQPGSSAAGTVPMSGEIRQVLTHQRVHAGVVLGGVPADGGQNVVIHAESDVSHMHSIRVTVSGRQPPDAPVEELTGPKTDGLSHKNTKDVNVQVGVTASTPLR